jgi:ADP-heptose:LPS heptosyltransferase
LAVEDSAAMAIEAKLRRLQVAPGIPLVVINPSASVLWKLWPGTHWATVTETLSQDAAIVVVGSHEQRARHHQIVASCGGTVADFTGETTLAELIALLDRAALHIAGDTGSSHIAAALGIPVVGIYGSSDPIRLAPYAQSHNLLSGIDECTRRCPHWCATAYRCLRTITPDRVVAQARRAMAAGPGPGSVAGARGREG